MSAQPLSSSGGQATASGESAVQPLDPRSSSTPSEGRSALAGGSRIAARMARLAAAARTRIFRKGQYLWYQGDPGDTLLVVCDGRLKIVLGSETGEEAVLHSVGGCEWCYYQDETAKNSGQFNQDFSACLRREARVRGLQAAGTHYCNTPRLKGGAAGRRGGIGWRSWGVVVLVGLTFCF